MNEEIAKAYDDAAKFLQEYLDKKRVRDEERAGWRAAVLELRFKAVRVKANDPEA